MPACKMITGIFMCEGAYVNIYTGTVGCMSLKLT